MFHHWFQSSAPEAGTKHIQCSRIKRVARASRRSAPTGLAASSEGGRVTDISLICSLHRRFHPSIHSHKKPLLQVLHIFCSESALMLNIFDPHSLIFELLPGNGAKPPATPKGKNKNPTKSCNGILKKRVARTWRVLLISSSLYTSAQMWVDLLDTPPVPSSPWTAAVVVFRSPQRCLCTGDTSWPEPACTSESWCHPSSWCSWCSGFYWTCGGEWQREGRKWQKKDRLKAIFHNNN